MIFENLNLLWLLLIIPAYFLLIFLSYQFYTKKLKRLFNAQQFNLLISDRSTIKTIIKRALQILALITLIISMLTPKWGDQENTTIQVGTDIVVLVDISTSMLVEDIKPNRLEKVKIKINQLIDLQKGNRLAIVLFAGSSFIYLPLTSDYNSLRTFVNEITPEMTSSQGTDLSLGLETALEVFHDETSQKILLVFTDGENHNKNFGNIIDRLNDEKVIVIAVGVGTPNGELIPLRNNNGEIIDYLKDQNGNLVISRLDYQTLSTISKQTGGVYFPSTLDKKDILSINELLSQYKKVKQADITQKNKQNRYQIFVLLSFLILFFEVLITNKKRKPPPKTP